MKSPERGPDSRLRNRMSIAPGSKRGRLSLEGEHLRGRVFVWMLRGMDIDVVRALRCLTMRKRGLQPSHQLISVILSVAAAFSIKGGIPPSPPRYLVYVAGWLPEAQVALGSGGRIQIRI